MNRQEKRKKSKPRHKNIFTKKYKNKKCRERAIENSIGSETYHSMRKQIADLKRKAKEKSNGKQ